ncbi:MAG: hypothetical protein IAF02_23515, partial [Anaerolineae bacterium]|nr:hypothetical protein [Anaerolineae bacterium]
MVRYWIFHPFIFAVYPVITLLAANLGKLAPERMVRSLIALLIFTLLILLAARIVSKGWHKAALLVSLFLIFFQSYGHVYRWSGDAMPIWFAQGQRFYIPILWLILLGIGIWLIWRIKQIREATMYANIVALTMIAIPLFQAGSYFFLTTSDNDIAVNRTGETTAESVSPFAPITLPEQQDDSEPPPDIYYILLDAYGRSDTLQELYDYDNSEFITSLEDKGFYVADRSITNYTRTLFVLSTMLNGGYLDDVAAKLGSDSVNTVPLENLVKQNRVVTALQENGYRIISISSGYEETSLANADEYLRFDAGGVNEFEKLLLMNTPLGALLGRQFGDLSVYETHRARVLYAFDQLGRMPEEDGPKFVFAHIMAPHPPYVFGPNGEALNLPGDPLLHEQLPVDVYTEAYRGEVNYVNTLVEEAVDKILANSETPPIIIMHGDHGPWLRFEATPEESCLKERYTIFNSFYFPDGDYDKLYDTISPVNTFRVVLDKYFDTDLGVLEDRTYFSQWPHLYDFVDVT